MHYFSLRFCRGARRLSSPSFMAPSLSSLLLSPSNPSFLSSPNPNLTHRRTISRRTQILSFTKNNNNNNNNNSSSKPTDLAATEKKSFAVATGELFLGLASRLFIRRGPSKGPNGEVGSVAMFEDLNGSGFYANGSGSSSKERIGAVMEDEIEPDVVWEQRVKDVEAERQRRVVTSPGFSFSAAGLLFPYHLGVAQFLIEKGYIKVCHCVMSNFNKKDFFFF